MMLRRNRIVKMTDPAELSRLARKDEPDVAQAAMDRLTELLGTGEIDRRHMSVDDLRWLGFASRLRLQDVRSWREALAAIRSADVFSNEGQWYRPLTRLMTGQLNVTCPGCGQRLILRREDGLLGLIIIDGVAHEIHPADPASLAPPERDFYHLIEAERPSVARVLLQLFSPIICPGCGTPSRLAQR